MIITVRTTRTAICTTNEISALDHFRKAAESGLRPVAVRFGGRALCEKEMERYADMAAQAFRVRGLRHLI